MSYPKINKVAVSKLFWKDLAKWRSHPEYWTIRRKIGELVQKSAAGEDAGDRAFQYLKWGDVRHVHVAAKLIVFLNREDDGTLRLNALKKHDFYGFRRERKKIAEQAAKKIHNAKATEPVASPEWAGLKWSDPGDIPDHPELPELSHDGLNNLLHDLYDEADTLDMLERAVSGMSHKMADRFADAWIDSLDEAMQAVEGRILELARRRTNILKPEEFDRWTSEPA